MSAVGAKCGHVKRQLSEGKRLTGELLEFALSLLPDEGHGPKNDALFGGIRQKLLTGHQLGEYEYHVFVEVHLLHVRLAAATRARLESEQGRERD